MIAPEQIMTVWKTFDDFPMETLTKAWYFNKAQKKQREVALMKEHRAQYGITGNCFDLAYWLLDEFKRSGVKAYPIGHDLHTEDAHVAVVAVDERGRRYLCDLGDQWIQPVLIDSECEDYSNEKLDGFFPGARIQVSPHDEQLTVLYERPNGKVSKQVYDTRVVEMGEFKRAAEHSQHLIKPVPLLECRVPFKEETAHWEFYNWRSFMSTTAGLYNERDLTSIEEWTARIHKRTGYDELFVLEVLEIYNKRRSVERR